MGILVVGSVAYDTIRTPEREVRDSLGGSATYFSAAASFFDEVKIVAVVGSDFDHSGLDFLRERGVDTQGLVVSEGKTFRWSGSYGGDMGDATTHETQLNVFQDFQPQIPEEYRDEEFVFLANIDPDLQSAVLDQMTRPRLVVCDTMNFWIEKKRDSLLRLLSRVNVFVLNETEAMELTGEDNVVRAARAILALGPKCVVVKQGAHGAMLVRAGEVLRMPAYPLEAVCDPTGAGDSFAGGFVGHLAESDELSAEGMHRAVLAGTVTASFNVESFSVDRLREISRENLDERRHRMERVAGWGWDHRD